ncbi:MAG TPA: hypothetical protein DEP70_00690 [Acholeplasmataceae bacterium]|nr:hypothetical protein [Acholeplasmataceae bacterium]
MNRTLDRLRFSFRFAYKNIIHFKLRSILLIVTFIALFSSLMLGISTKPFIQAYFYGELEERYQDIDLTMATTLNGNLRYFSITQLKNYEDPEDFIEDYMPFFEMDALIGVGDTKVYVKTMASSLAMFNKVSNGSTIESVELNGELVFITSSMAESYDLSVGGSLTLYVGSSNHIYQIAEIIEDGGLFQGETIFINKSENLSFFLSALNPALGGLPSSLMENIYNKVYFELSDEVTVLEAIETIQSISPYDTLSFEESIDVAALNQLINRSVSVFNLVILIVILAVLLVMQTTFLLYYDEKRKSFAVISLLGGKKRFSYSVILIEMIIFIFISTVLSVLLSNFVIKLGLRYIGSTSGYQLNRESILLSVIVASFLFIFTSLYYFYYFNKHSSISQTVESVADKKPRILFLAGIVMLSLIGYGILNLKVVTDRANGDQAITKALISIILLFSIAFLLIELSSRLTGIKEKALSFSLHLKILLSKKSFYQYTAVLLVCFVSIFLLVLTNEHMKYRINSYHEEYTLDFGLTNFVTRYDQTFLEIGEMEQVESVSKAGLFANVSFAEMDKSLNQVISIDAVEIDNFFNLPIDQSSLSSLSRTDVLTILLPTKFQYIYNLQIGDSILLNISPEFPEESFEIGGFFEKQIGDLAFINLHLFPIYQDISYNSLLINAADSPIFLRDLLIDSYSKNLVYLIDFQELITDNANEMKRTTEYMTIILSVIILCFILAIFNHSILLLGQMKSVYARLNVLGYSKNQLTKLILKESLMMFVILLFSATISFVMLSAQLRGLVIISGDYENIYFRESSLIYGWSIILVVFIFTKYFYLRGVSVIDASSVLKSY